MKNRISILTLSVLCAIAVFGENDANAQRGRKRSRVLAVRGLTKVQNASDYANSDGANQNVPVARAATADDCGAGTYFDAASSSCLVCASGTWSTAKSSGCTSCGDNVIACDATNGNPIACATGYKLDGSTCVKDETTPTPAPAPENETIKNLRQKFALQLTEVSAECSGIAGELERIEALNGTATISGGIAGLAGAGAIVENHVKKGEGDSREIATNKVARVATIGGATAASGVATGTSIAATVNADKLAKRVAECDARINDLKIIKNTLVAEIQDLDKDPNVDKTVIQADKVLTACSEKFDKATMTKVFGKALASSITSGVGTITGGIATGLTIAGKGDKGVVGVVSTNDLLAGATAGAGAATAVLGGINWAQLEKMKKNAQECENALRGNLVDVKFTTETKLEDIPYANETTTTTDTTEGGESTPDTTEGGESTTDPSDGE